MRLKIKDSLYLTHVIPCKHNLSPWTRDEIDKSALFRVSGRVILGHAHFRDRRAHGEKKVEMPVNDHYKVSVLVSRVNVTSGAEDMPDSEENTEFEPPV